MNIQNRTLFFGDNLKILREKLPDEIFDLIYLDPPFNSQRSYNILFKHGVEESQSQIRAFEDTWHWTREAQAVFTELVTGSNEQISSMMLALEKFLAGTDMLAYLTMMTVRLVELHRVLKSTGSIYLHCDPTASHYLRIVMDAIFGVKNFRNEIIWKRSVPHNDAGKFGSQHDTILYYVKSGNYFWQKTYQPLSEDYIENFYKSIDKSGRKYQLTSTTAPGGRGPSYEFMGITRNWRYTQDNMQKLFEEGKIIQTAPGTVPRYKRYLDEQEGVTTQDIWTDIKPVQSQSAELLGYPTQKPEELLERILKASSKVGDWVLDPFCGCGTTVAASEKLERNWVGIDITILAINLIKSRLENQFSDKGTKVIVDGIPTDYDSAKAFFEKDPYQFEMWAVTLVGGMSKEKKGADKGIDGVVVLKDVNTDGKIIYRRGIIQVKGGGVQRNQVATLKSDVDREKADFGIFITLEKPTRAMEEEAITAGQVEIIFNKAKFPKIQILTIEDLLKGQGPNLPMGLLSDFLPQAQKKSTIEAPTLF